MRDREVQRLVARALQAAKGAARVAQRVQALKAGLWQGCKRVCRPCNSPPLKALVETVAALGGSMEVRAKPCPAVAPAFANRWRAPNRQPRCRRHARRSAASFFCNTTLRGFLITLRFASMDHPVNGGTELRLDRVSRWFGATAALRDVSLSCAGGRFFVLLGPSGCGKSTLLRVIAGLDTQHSGHVMIGGRDVTELPPKDRGIAMVFQNYALFPHLSVAENIVFGLRARKVPRAERDRRLLRAAELLGLTQLLSRRPNQLSGGQQQRVALARAVVAEAPICLMDEPLSNLDAKLRTEMRRELRTLQRRLGITMIYVTHDQAEALSMADQVVLLNEGRVEQDSPPAELYARPASLFAASFIGTPAMSLLRLAPREDGAVIAGTNGPVVAPANAAHAILGVRPEEVSLTDGAGISAAVISAEYLGAETVLSCAVGTPAQVIQARLPGNHSLAAGTAVQLRLPRRLHLFDPATGRRLPETMQAFSPVDA